MKRNLLSAVAITACVLFFTQKAKAQWSVTGNAATDTAVNFIGTTDNKGMKIKTNNTDRMWIGTNNRVGIGTNTPGFNLEVYQSGAATTALRSGTASATMSMDRGLATGNAAFAYKSLGTTLWNSGIIGTDNFTIRNVAANANVFTITTSNLVGIGTTTPTSKLTVLGNGPTAGISIYSGNNLTTFLNIGRFTTPDMTFGVPDAPNNYLNGTIAGDGVIRVNDAAKKLVFGAGIGVNPAMVVTGSYVGIGTTAPTAKLDVAGDASINGMKLGRSGGNSTTNTAFGINSLINNTTGADNTSVGSESMVSNSTGNDNTALGYHTLLSNSSGPGNTALGAYALENNTTARWNTAIGGGALRDNNGWDNTAIGTSALGANTTGESNAATGMFSLAQNTTGNGNTANGRESLLQNQTGSGNSAFGQSALHDNIGGTLNSAIGYEAFFTNAGSLNTALGAKTTIGNSGILDNATAVGAFAQVDTSNSIVLGSIAGVNTAIASTNVGIGTTKPAARLDVAGNVKIADGTEGAGKVLTSDANGLAHWSNPTVTLPSNDSSVTVQVTSSSANAFVVPAGVYYINVEAVGGSGGGGSSGGCSCIGGCVSGAGGGGGGGEYGAMLLPVTPGDIIGVTVGSAGLGSLTVGYGDGFAGTSGGATIVTLNGNSVLSLNGGAGGFGGQGANTTTQIAINAPGGAGGSGSIAPIEIPGETSPNYVGGLSAVVKNGASVTGGVGGARVSTIGGGSGIGLVGASGMTGRVAITYYNPAATNGNSTIHDGAVVFSQAGQLTGNTAFYWDNTNGRLGVGTNTPDAKLVVVGTLKIADGTQGAGKVLTSDANGFATWVSPGPSSAKTQLSTWTEEQQKEVDAKDAAIKNLQTTVSNLQNENEAMRSQIKDMQQCVESLCNATPQNAETKTVSSVSQNTLFQNQPNPFNQSTVIRYEVLGNSNYGKIIIRDLNGNLVKSIAISNSGKGQITVNANELVAGTYTYTLEINNESVDTKLMVVTK